MLKINYIKLVLILCLIIISLGILSACYKGPEKNVIFINQEVNLHKEYLIQINHVAESDSINILANINDLETSKLIGIDTHFIEVNITIKRNNVSEPKEDHLLDVNDFKLKDHTGIQVKNVYFQSVQNGLALSEKDFSTIKAVTDYAWIDKKINPSKDMTFSIYFEIDKEFSVYNTLMILEADFFALGKDSTGVDIALANKE